MTRRAASVKAPFLKAMLLAALSWPGIAHAQTITYIQTAAGGGTGGVGDGGLATKAVLTSPAGLAFDASGNLYISEFDGHRVRKVDATSGIITTVAGTGVAGHGGDGGLATAAQLMSPRGIALDASGNLYIADMSNHRVRKVNAATGIITTVAGTGTAGDEGDGGTATLAQLNYPSGVAVTSDGEVLIADRENHRIRAISRGSLVTVAGTGVASFSGDGGAATVATLNMPWGVAVDAADNVYIVDTGNQRIRRVSALSGRISTVAGTGTAGYNGDGQSATTANLYNPLGVCAGASGTFYVADQTNHRIRKVTRAITTVAGSGTGGFSGDGGTALAAELRYPKDVAISPSGELYIADTENDRVRRLYAIRSTPGDFEHDYKSDILWWHIGHGDLWEWRMNGAAKLEDNYVGTVSDTANWAPRFMVDLDGDGKTDILWRNNSTGELYYWRMDGSETLKEVSLGVVDLAYAVVGVGDYNGDGRDDILWRHTPTGAVWIWLMNDSARLDEQYVATVDQHYVARASGDFDGDGRADIVWQHAVDGDVWVWLMDGAAPASEAYVGTVPDTTYVIRGAADHSGDGRAEIEWWNTGTGEVWIWTMDGTLLTAETWVATVPDTNYRIAGNGDYDGDGKADFIWHHMLSGDVWMWLMNGTTKQSESFVGSVPDTQYRIVR